MKFKKKEAIPNSKDYIVNIKDTNDLRNDNKLNSKHNKKPIFCSNNSKTFEKSNGVVQEQISPDIYDIIESSKKIKSKYKYNAVKELEKSSSQYKKAFDEQISVLVIFL